MIGLRQRLERIDNTREFKPLRDAPWVQECRELLTEDHVGNELVCHIDYVRAEIRKATGFDKIRLDVWRYLHYEAAMAARAV